MLSNVSLGDQTVLVQIVWAHRGLPCVKCIIAWAIKSRWAMNVDLLIWWAVEICCVEVHLMQNQVRVGGNGADKLQAVVTDYRWISIVIVDALNLGETFGNESCRITYKFVVEIVLLAKTQRVSMRWISGLRQTAVQVSLSARKVNSASIALDTGALSEFDLAYGYEFGIRSRCWWWKLSWCQRRTSRIIYTHLETTGQDALVATSTDISSHSIRRNPSPEMIIFKKRHLE